METRGVEVLEFKAGVFRCPVTGKEAELRVTRAIGYIQWPVVVEHCPQCDQKHVLNIEDVRHAPVFGYE